MSPKTRTQKRSLEQKNTCSLSPLTHSIPSESEELLRSARDMGKEFNHHGSQQNCTKTCSWDNHCAPWRAAVVHDEWKTCSKKNRSWSSNFKGRHFWHKTWMEYCYYRTETWGANKTCCTSKKLSAIGTLLREMRSDGMLCSRVSGLLFHVCAPSALFWEAMSLWAIQFLVDFFEGLCAHIGFACERCGWLGSVWPDLTWLVKWPCPGYTIIPIGQVACCSSMLKQPVDKFYVVDIVQTGPHPSNAYTFCVWDRSIS